MTVLQIQKISCLTLVIIEALLLIPSSDTTIRFTRFPPSVLYVSTGGTARFEWDYHVDDRREEFQPDSPAWSFIGKSGKESIIGSDIINNWSFVIYRATCPPRLLNPDRVRKESTATLVITDVTTADNGIYQCSLKRKAGNAIKHQVQLVVTVRPTFLPSHPNKTYRINEGQDLKIICTAIGPPTPNITWVNVTDGSIATKSLRSAVLLIENIKPYHAGIYECQARNNPDVNVATTRTHVVVFWRTENYCKQKIEKSKCTTVVGVISSLLVVSIGLNVLLPVFSWRMKKRNEIREQRNEERNINHDGERDGEATEISGVALSQVPEYEYVEQPMENTDSPSTLCKNASQYQELNPSLSNNTAGSLGSTYEPLRPESTTQTLDNDQHHYETADNNSDYQSLQTSDRQHTAPSNNS